MRPKIIAANWKMHKTRAEARDFVQQLANRAGDLPENIKLLIFPPYTALEATRDAIISKNLKNCSLGAQNIHPQTHGAFTGEISAAMLKDVGVQTVLIGHSERRTLFGENDDFLLKKVLRCLAENLTPMLCVGETLEERDAGATYDVLSRQISAIFSAINPQDAERVQIAYEPVWAIGTGRTATPLQAREAHCWIRKKLAQICPGASDKIPILYGGSVKPDNAHDILHQPDVDGALIGGASLQPDSYAAIAQAVR
jgi:triosephosphate isomerase